MGNYLRNRVGVMVLGNCVGGILLVKWNWWMCAGGRLVLEGCQWNCAVCWVNGVGQKLLIN